MNKSSVSNGQIVIMGNLYASGTAGRPIVFTSITDPEYGGINPTAWSGISVNSNGELDLNHVEIRYASNAINSSGNLNISNSKISNSSGNGIYISTQAMNVTIENNEIIDNGGSGVYISYFNGGEFFFNKNTISNNKKESIAINLTGYNPTNQASVFQNNSIDGRIKISGTLQQDFSLNKNVYNLEGELVIPTGKTLIIEPGAIINQTTSKSTSITVGGKLDATGTVGNPIIFTNYSDPMFGVGTTSTFWSGFNVRDTGELRLDYTEIRYTGGYAINDNGNLYISNSKICNSSGSGIYISTRAMNVTIENNEIIDNGGSGVNISYFNVGEFSFNENTISNNKKESIVINLTGYKPSNSTDILKNNTIDGRIKILGTLQQDLTLNKNVYNLEGELVIPTGKTLIIEPGAIINQTASKSTSITVEGKVDASGTVSNPIIFTNYSDPMFGGTTTAYWDGFSVKSLGELKLDCAEIRYTGSNAISNYGNLELRNSKIENTNGIGISNSTGSKNVIIKNNKILNTRSVGIYLSMLKGGIFDFNDNTISNSINESMTIILTNYKPDSEVGGIESNQLNGAVNIYGIFQRDMVLAKRTYNILGDLTIPTGINLKIEAGSILNEKVATTSQIIVAGNLEARGTSNNPIIFTNNSDPLVGKAQQFYWKGINVNSGGKLVLDHGEIRYAASNGIYNSGSLDITNSKITNTQGSAISLSCNNKDIRIENNEISKCGSTGIYISDVRRCNLTVQKNVIQECIGKSITVSLTGFKPKTLTGVFEFNTLDDIIIYGTLFQDLKLPKNIYVISSYLVIPSGVTLTIDAGSVIKVKALSGEAIKVEGTLNANGTSKNPIIFTSFEDPQYGGVNKITYWGEFAVTSKGVLRLDYTQIRYSGLGKNNTAGNAISCSGTLRMNNSTIANSNGNGIVFSTGIQPLLKDNSFINNVNYSVNNSRYSSMTIDATNNYWGSAAGPALYNKTTKTWSTDGGKISDGVSYIPFYKEQTEMPNDTPVDTEKWSLLVIKNASNENTKIYTLETEIESEKVTIILDESEQTAVKLVMKNGSWVESPQLSANTLRANALSASTQQGYSYWVQWFSKKADSVVEKKLIELLAPDVRTKITEIFGESVPSSSYQMIERGISDSINDNLYNGLINKVQSAFRPTSNIMYARAKMITDAFFVAAYMEAADKPISLVLPYVGGANEQEIFKSIIRDNNATSLVVALPLLPLITSVMSAVVVVIIGQDAIKAIANELTNLVADFRESLSKVFENETSMTVNVSFTDTTITIEETEYALNITAEEATADMKKNKDMYYPALLSNGMVLVAPVAVDRKTALEIMKKNDGKIGIFASTTSYARGLCNSLGGAVGPEAHGGGEGYWSHYHGNSYRKAHCWYVI